MENSFYAEIFDMLQDVLPADWTKVLYYAVVTDSSFSMKYFADTGSGTWTEGRELPGISRMQITRTYMRMYRAMQAVRETLPAKEKWSSLVLAVDAEGNFKADLGYDDVSESFTAKCTEIEEKYLA